MPFKAWVHKLWPHTRAALVLFHVVGMFVLGFPAPVGGLDRAEWKLPNVQRDFESWASALHVSEPVFEDFIFSAAQLIMTVRDQAVRPFAPYAAWTGCEQPWRMFVGPVVYTSRLQIQVRRQGAARDAWETWFEERSDEHRWRESVFAPDRLRSQISRWSWPRFGRDYDAGCSYFARQAFEDDASVTDVRCRFFHVQSPTPDQVREHTEPQGSFINVIERHRPGARP
jgi:hypothetical protein